MKTKAGTITTEFYNDGIAKGLQVLIGGEIVAMIDVLEDTGEARVIVYKDGEDEPSECISLWG